MPLVQWTRASLRRRLGQDQLRPAKIDHRSARRSQGGEISLRAPRRIPADNNPDLDDLSGMQSLQGLRLINAGVIRSLVPLRRLSRLREFRFNEVAVTAGELAVLFTLPSRVGIVPPKRFLDDPGRYSHSIDQLRELRRLGRRFVLAGRPVVAAARSESHLVPFGGELAAFFAGSLGTEGDERPVMRDHVFGIDRKRCSRVLQVLDLVSSGAGR